MLEYNIIVAPNRLYYNLLGATMRIEQSIKHDLLHHDWWALTTLFRIGLASMVGTVIYHWSATYLCTFWEEAPFAWCEFHNNSVPWTKKQPWILRSKLLVWYVRVKKWKIALRGRLSFVHFICLHNRHLTPYYQRLFLFFFFIFFLFFYFLKLSAKHGYLHTLSQISDDVTKL